jgi:hypothetical protein
VARQLGIPEGTLSGRLTTARRMLARRLAHPGLALSAGALTAAWTQGAASACVSSPLVVATARAAVSVAAGGAAAAVVSARVAALAEGAVRAMYVTKLKTATILLLVAAIAVGAGVLAHQPTAAEQPGAQAIEKPPATPPILLLAAKSQGQLPEKAELSISDIMVKAHLKPQNRSTRNNLDSKVIDGKATAAEQQELLMLYTALSNLKPPRGDLVEWKTRTGEMVGAVKAVIRDEAKAADRLTKARDCKSCHDKYWPN